MTTLGKIQGRSVSGPQQPPESVDLFEYQRPGKPEHKCSERREEHEVEGCRNRLCKCVAVQDLSKVAEPNESWAWLW